MQGPLEDIINELQHMSVEEKLHLPFDKMTAEQLVGYIIIHHHFYVKQSMPLIFSHLEKVVNKHGSHYPHMQMVLKLFSVVKDEMDAHMEKEETVLFPRIKGLEAFFKNKEQADIADDYISGPINVMEAEHDKAGNILYEITELTNNYTAPADACTTFRISLSELKEFEEDLHRHVHLENNILFPLVTGMLRSLKKR